MLGQTIRAARIKKGLTQARLARLAGVSRRHLAALEKGANVSVLVLKKVAAVLELTEIDLGDVTLRTTRPPAPAINMPLLAETVHEAHNEAMRTQALLARAEALFGEEKKLGLIAHFPKLAAVIGAYEAGFDAYQQRDWATALQRFGDALELAPSDRPSRIFIDRCRYYRKNPPSEEWNGVWIMEEK